MSYPAQAVLAGERLLLSGSAHLLTHPKQVHFLDEDYRHGNFRELLAIEGTQLRSLTTAYKLAAHPLPLPAIDESEDTPPFTQATDGLNIEPNQAPLDHPDIDEWGIYRGD